MIVKLVLLKSIVCLAASATAAQSAADLLKDIEKIPAIDNHSHVEMVVNAGERDGEGDAISCGGLEFIAPPPVRLRSDNLIYLDAWRGLFGFRGLSMGAEQLREYTANKQKTIREKGDDYPSWVLDKLNIDVMLANRITMGRGLKNKRFRWVAYGDPYMLPFSTRRASAKNSDQRFFYSQEEKLLRRFMAETDLTRLPVALDQYLTRFVNASLDRNKAAGAVAVKFVASYYRRLEFEDVTRAEAARIYRTYAAGGEPPASDYKKFQDFMFRYVAVESGKRGLAVHIHTGGGCGHYFSLSAASPALLDSVLNDPALRATNFVLIHGGYPFVKEAEFYMEKPNVYADFSAQTFLLSPRALGEVLRSWLEYEPEKILFGTDASPSGPEVGWEESAWMTTNTAREALAIALSGMISDKAVTRERAMELAEMVMRGNAARLYKIGN